MPIDNEVKDALNSLGTAFNEFKAANDARLKEVEKKGTSDVIGNEKVDRINKELSDLQEKAAQAAKKQEERLAMLEAKANRLQGGGKAEDEAAMEHKNVFINYMRKGNEDALKQIEQKAMTVGSDPDGGYLVPRILADKIITRQFDTTPMRQISSVMTLGAGDAVEMIRDTDETGAQWVGEIEARNETTSPQVGRIRIPVQELHASPQISQKLLDDSILGHEDWIVTKIADRFSRRENEAFIKGTGINSPSGFTSKTTAATGDSSRAWGTLEHVVSGTNGNLTASDPLITLLYKLKSAYLTDAVWLMGRAMQETVRKLKDTSNQYLWAPSMVADKPATLLGYPVIESEDMPTIATNSLSVAFGNFKEGYQIVDRYGIRILRDPYTAAPYIKFRATKRVGGDVTNYEAIKLLRLST